MFWPVSVVPSCRAMSSATTTWRWCCLLLLPCELWGEGTIVSSASLSEQGEKQGEREGERGAPVDHDLVRHARLAQALGRLLHVLRREVGPAVRAAEDDVARRVAVRLDDCRREGLESQLGDLLEAAGEEREGGGRTGRDALLRHREERVRRRCGADGVDGDLERAVRAVLEADCARGASESAWASECARRERGARRTRHGHARSWTRGETSVRGAGGRERERRTTHPARGGPATRSLRAQNERSAGSSSLARALGRQGTHSSRRSRPTRPSRR